MLLGGEMSASRSLGVCAGGSSRRPGGGPYAACSIVCCGRGALSVMSEKCGMMMLRKIAVLGAKCSVVGAFVRDNAPRRPRHQSSRPRD